MSFLDFWLQSNNGNKLSLQNLKELKKSDLEGANSKLINLFNIFNTTADDKLDKAELVSLFQTIGTAAQSATGKNSSIFETEEAEEFVNITKISEGKTLSELGIDAADVFEFLSKLATPLNNSKNTTSNVHLTDENAKNEVLSVIVDDVIDARELLSQQDNGVVSDVYDKYKEWRDDDLSLSNVEEAVLLQQKGADSLYKAKEGKLTKREYFLQNREHLKTLMKRRLFRKDEKTGLDFLDRNRGKMTKEQFASFMENYINEQIDKIDKLDSIKNIQHTLFVTTEAGVEQMLKNYKENAEKELLRNPVAEQNIIKLNTPSIPKEYDTTELISFEEVFRFERNQEYSKEKVENYLKQKQKTDFALGAYNKYQTFKSASENFLGEYKSSVIVSASTTGVSQEVVKEPNPDERANKLVELFTKYYKNSFAPELAKEELERLISENDLPISVITKGDGSITLDLSKLANDNQKNKVLNQLVQLEDAKLKGQLEATLGGDIEERLTLISQQTQSAYTSAYGEDFTHELAQAMADDNKTFIKKYTGTAALAGMGLATIGGVLCLTPIGSVGLAVLGLKGTLGGLVYSAGNAIAIGSMVSESGLGYAEALTRNSINDEEIEDLNKALIMNTAGFVIGYQASNLGMKAFNNLIDNKLSAVSELPKLSEAFKSAMVQGNRAQALKLVFTNSEYLSQFMLASGAKLSTDFVISLAGDLVMMGVLDTEDDWMSLLQSNLIGIIAGMGGDIKGVADLGLKGDRYRALSQLDEASGNKGVTPEYLELEMLKNDPDIRRAYQSDEIISGQNPKIVAPQVESVKVLPAENGEGFVVKIGDTEYIAKSFEEVGALIDENAPKDATLDLSAIELMDDIAAKGSSMDESFNSLKSKLKQKALYTKLYSKLKFKNIPDEIVSVIKQMFFYCNKEQSVISDSDFISLAESLNIDKNLSTLTQKLMVDKDLTPKDVYSIINHQIEFENTKDLDIIIDLYKNKSSAFVKDYSGVVKILLANPVEDSLHNLLKQVVNDNTTDPSLLKSLVNDVVWAKSETHPLHDYHRSYFDLKEKYSSFPDNYKDFAKVALDKLAIKIDNIANSCLDNLHKAKTQNDKMLVNEMMSVLSRLEYSLGNNRMIAEKDVQILRFRMGMIMDGEYKDKNAIEKTYMMLVETLEQVKSKENPIKSTSNVPLMIQDATLNLDTFKNILDLENIEYVIIPGESTTTIRLKVPCSESMNGDAKIHEYTYNTQNGYLESVNKKAK